MAEIYESLWFPLRSAICRGAMFGVAIPPVIPPTEADVASLSSVKITFYNPYDGGKYLEIGSDTAFPVLTSVDYVIGKNGCGKFSLELNALPNVYIIPRSYVDVSLFGDALPKYSGFVQTTPPVHKEQTTYKFGGFGFFEQLKWILVDGSWSAAEVSGIVDEIITTFVEPFTDIVYNASKIIGTDYQGVNIDFAKVTALDALTDLATLAGNYEFGVDWDRQFFFRPISTEVNPELIFFHGRHFESFEPKIDTSKVANRLHLKSGELKTAGDNEGTNWAAPVEDAASIATYGLREQVVSLPTALDDADVARWGQYKLETMKDAILTGQIKNVSMTTDRVEATGKCRVWMTRDVPPDWDATQLGYIGTHVPGWDWGGISISETYSGQIFWDWVEPGLVTFCFEMYIRELSYKISDSFSVDLQCGELEDYVAKEFVNLVTNVETEELLQASNTSQLYALT